MRGGLDPADVARLMPMHLLLDAGGAILGSGPTLRKLMGDARRLEEAFSVERPHVGANRGPAEAVLAAATTGERVFLRQLAPPCAVLRGHAVPAGDGARVLVNLGFGIGLPQAVRHFGLTDGDFAPNELALELLFLHEANHAAMGALSRFNARLDEARAAAELQSHTDPLTGLMNRRGFETVLAGAISAARRAAGGAGRRSGGPAGFALAHLDLDGFKPINDTHGHAAGDVMLAHVAAVLRQETRASDCLARPGGDEFALLLPGLVSVPALEQLAERIIARIGAPVVVGGVELSVSASLGVALSTDHPLLDAAGLSADADAALYAAKRAGRGLGWRSPGPGLPAVPLSRAAAAGPPAGAGDVAAGYG